MNSIHLRTIFREFIRLGFHAFLVRIFFAMVYSVAYLSTVPVIFICYA
jgi:hypothetical protein